MKWPTLLLLFILASCNSKESELSSLSGVADSSSPYAPYITLVTPPANGIYEIGMSFSYDFKFSRSVEVLGTPRMRITTEYGTYYANYASGTGTDTLRFTYTVVNGVSDDNGITLPTTLELNGGSIYDPADDVDARLTFLPPASWGVYMDGVTPTIVSITPPSNGNYTTGQTLEFVLTFSARVCGYGNPRLQLSIGANLRFADRVVEACATTMKFRYTVIAADEDTSGIQLTGGAVDLTAPGAAIRDSFGDSATVLFVNALYPSVKVNDIGPPPAELASTPPAAGWYKKDDVITFTMNFDQNITVSGGTPHLSIDIGGVSRNATWDPLSNGTSSVVFKYTVGATDMDADGLTIGNMSYNGSSLKGPNNLTVNPSNVWTHGAIKVDGVAPTIAQLQTPGNGNLRTGQNLDFVVTWSENVFFSAPFPHLKISIDSDASVKQAESHSHGGNLTTYRYALQNADADFNGISLPFSALSLPAGGTVRDEAGNNAVLTFPAATTSGIRVVPLTVTNWYDPRNPSSFGTSGGGNLNQLLDLIGGVHAQVVSPPKWDGQRINFENSSQQFRIGNFNDFEKVYIVLETKGVNPGSVVFESNNSTIYIELWAGVVTASAPPICGDCAQHFNGTTWVNTNAANGNFGNYALNSKKIIMIDYSTNMLDNVDLNFGGGYIGYIHEIFILKGADATANAAPFLRALQQKHTGATLP